MIKEAGPEGQREGVAWHRKKNVVAMEVIEHLGSSLGISE